MLAEATAPATGDKLAFSILPPGATAGVKITASNLLLNDPNERRLQMPRALREYNYTLLGINNTGTLGAPVTIAAFTPTP
jgi:hypothetical protein